MPEKKQCSFCKNPMVGMKDATRRAFCSRACYIQGCRIETDNKQTIRRRHQRDMPTRGLTRICVHCQKRQECQRHHEDILNPKKLPIFLCKACHVARDMKLGKWGVGKPKDRA